MTDPATYGPGVIEAFHCAASFVDRVLRGAKPVDLPIEQLAKLELVIDLQTARAPGLSIPPSLLARHDEVIK